LFATKKWKILNNDISGNIEAVFFKLGTTNVHEKKQNDTLSAVAVATI